MKISTQNKFLIIIAIIIGSFLIKKYKLFDKPKKETGPVATSPTKRLFPVEKKFQTLEEIEDLFKKLGLTYTPRLKYSKECESLKKMKKEDLLEYEQNKAVYDARTAKYEEDIKAAYIAPIYIKWVSDEIGYGVFASEDIPEGTLISEYVGDVVLKHMIKNRKWSWKFPSRSKFVDKYPQQVSINGYKTGNEIRFINDRATHNVATTLTYGDGTWHILYVATKFIKKDEELSVSYGKPYWRTKKKL